MIVEELLPPVERNGYTRLTLNRDSCEIALYAAQTQSPKADLLQLELLKQFTI
jgi:hypothetical protein